MAVTIIFQWTRDNVRVSTTVVTTATVQRGMAFDGSFLWTSAGDLNQYSLSPVALVRTVTIAPVGTFDDLTFDGENFWGPITGNAGIGMLSREGTRMNFIGSITSQSPEGIAHDGSFLWLHYPNLLSGGSTLIQVDSEGGSGFTIVKSYAISQRLIGLTFDGEFLVSLVDNAGARDLVFIDRGGTVVKQSAGTAGTANKNGLAFDGEFFYNMLSV